MIYVHAVGIVNAIEGNTLDVKATWKEISPKMIRRTDRFIQLSLLGAYRAVGGRNLSKNTALYMASGQGNLAVFKRLRDQRYIHKQPPKPVDFINSLSNTSGFYVAQFFGIEGKNLNVSRLGFVAETLLLLAQTDLELHKEEQILLGGVDELQEPVPFTRRTLGLCDQSLLGEGSNWMLLSQKSEAALASLEVVKKMMTIDQLKTYLSQQESSYVLAFDGRCDARVKERLSEYRSVFEAKSGFYETAALYTLNRFIEIGSSKLLFIAYYEDFFRVVKINKL